MVFDIEILKVENLLYGYSVLIKQKNTNLKLWLDFYVENEDIICEWNKYIFDLNNSEDLKIKKLQENSVFGEYAESEIIEYLEKENLIKQKNDGKWYLL